MKSFVVSPLEGALSGILEVPGDKSIGHRAALFAAIATGTTEIRKLSRGADNRATVAAVRQLGAQISEQDEVLRVQGLGLRGLRPAPSPIDCGNAGTAMRLLCGVLAGQSFDTVLVGDESLSVRPMKRISEPLAAMGVEVRGRSENGNLYPPLTVVGGSTVRGIRYQMPVASAQVKSAVLLAGLYAEGLVQVVEPGPSRDHTEVMLSAMGAAISSDSGVVSLTPPRELHAVPVVVPGDPSSAAFLAVAAAIVPGSRLSIQSMCTNSTRTGFLDVLRGMGAELSLEDERSDGESMATLVVGGHGGLRPMVIDGGLSVRSIDELPILAVAAAFADGVSDFRDAGELRVKESDRIATTVSMLRAYGVEVEERPDGFSVAGDSTRTLKAARIDAAGNHRIAMAAAVAALRGGAESRIDDVANVATSFPGFAEVFARAGASLRQEG